MSRDEGGGGWRWSKVTKFSFGNLEIGPEEIGIEIGLQTKKLGGGAKMGQNVFVGEISRSVKLEVLA
jgi:hypothetical protein